MCNPNPYQSKAHAAALGLARAISDHLTPRTAAYHEIWLDGEKVIDTLADEEPIYGRHYLPRKFKTVVAVPPSNDVDVFAQDLGFIAITDEDGRRRRLQRHGRRRHGHDPRRARDLPAHRRRHGLLPARAGGRGRRAGGHGAARLSAIAPTASTRGSSTRSTIAGLAWFRAEVERRLGYALEAPRPFRFDHTGDRYGWVEDHEGNWHYTLFIENGRVKDAPAQLMKTGLRTIAGIHQGDFRLTANQNLIIASVPARQKAADRPAAPPVRADQRAHRPAAQLDGLRGAADLRRWRWPRASATCPTWCSALEGVIEQAGLRDDEIVIRMTGCPNGCARPYLAEIGLVGRAPGKYNLYLGAAFDGSRLNKLYRKDVGHDEIVAALTPLIESYAKERLTGERFGDFVIRAGHVAPTTAGRDFHANLADDLRAA